MTQEFEEKLSGSTEAGKEPGGQHLKKPSAKEVASKEDPRETPKAGAKGIQLGLKKHPGKVIPGGTRTKMGASLRLSNGISPNIGKKKKARPSMSRREAELADMEYGGGEEPEVGSIAAKLTWGSENSQDTDFYPEDYDEEENTEMSTGVEAFEDTFSMESRENQRRILASIEEEQKQAEGKVAKLRSELQQRTAPVMLKSTSENMESLGAYGSTTTGWSLDSGTGGAIMIDDADKENCSLLGNTATTSGGLLLDAGKTKEETLNMYSTSKLVSAMANMTEEDKTMAQNILNARHLISVLDMGDGSVTWLDPGGEMQTMTKEKYLVMRNKELFTQKPTELPERKNNLAGTLLSSGTLVSVELGGQIGSCDVPPRHIPAPDIATTVEQQDLDTLTSTELEAELRTFMTVPTTTPSDAPSFSFAKANAKSLATHSLRIAARKAKTDPGVAVEETKVEDTEVGAQAIEEPIPPKMRAGKSRNDNSGGIMENIRQGYLAEAKIAGEAQIQLNKKIANERERLAENMAEQLGGGEVRLAKMRALLALSRAEQDAYDLTPRKGPSAMKEYCLINPLGGIDETWIGKKPPIPNCRKEVLSTKTIPNFAARQSLTVLEAAVRRAPELARWWRQQQKAATIVDKIFHDYNIKWGGAMARPQMLQLLSILIEAQIEEKESEMFFGTGGATGSTTVLKAD